MALKYHFIVNMTLWFTPKATINICHRNIFLCLLKNGWIFFLGKLSNLTFERFWSREISETYGFTLVRPYVQLLWEISASDFFCFFSWSTGSINAIFAFLQKIKNWPFFGQKWSKIVYFWPKQPKISFLLIFSMLRIIFFWFFSRSLGFIKVKMAIWPMWPIFGPFQGVVLWKTPKIA